MVDYGDGVNLTKETPRWLEGGTGPGVPANASARGAAVRLAKHLDASYDRMAAEAHGLTVAEYRRRFAA